MAKPFVQHLPLCLVFFNQRNGDSLQHDIKQAIGEKQNQSPPSQTTIPTQRVLFEQIQRCGNEDMLRLTQSKKKKIKTTTIRTIS